VFLVLNGPHAVTTRDELLAMFWPDLPEHRARNSLTQALSFLRRELGADVIQSVGRQAVRIESGVVECDAVELERLLDGGDRETALGLYSGRLLPAFHVEGAPDFEFWLSQRRQALHGKILSAAKEACDARIADGDHAGAARLAARTFELEPTDEVAAHRAMLDHLIAVETLVTGAKSDDRDAGAGRRRKARS
jgi:DNA-binding SARP family transcriptional activator